MDADLDAGLDADLDAGLDADLKAGNRNYEYRISQQACDCMLALKAQLDLLLLKRPTDETDVVGGLKIASLVCARAMQP
jgi:hypothetical protein